MYCFEGKGYWVNILSSKILSELIRMNKRTPPSYFVLGKK